MLVMNPQTLVDQYLKKIELKLQVQAIPTATAPIDTVLADMIERE